MNRHFFTAGFTAIATLTAMATAPMASAATLSSQASDLLGMTEGTSEYDLEYNRVSGLYQDQAKSYSLGFDDWFAMNSFVNHERAAYGPNNTQLQELTELNLDSLTWEAGAHDVEVFFINEGAGYWNKFGYSTVNLPDRPADSDLQAPRRPPSFERWFDTTYPDVAQTKPNRENFDSDEAFNSAKNDFYTAAKASHQVEYDAEWDAYNQANAPLREFWDTQVNVMWDGIASQNSILANGGSMALGEGYRIGDVAAGDTVNFFLRNPHENVFDSGSAATTFNADQLQHVTTYQYKDYLVLAYEDLYYGGDKDYNDVVIAVKGLVDTESGLAAESVPEPASLLALLGLGIAGLVSKRK